MRKARKNTATRQVIHIVGEGLTELFYFNHSKKILGYVRVYKNYDLFWTQLKRNTDQIFKIIISGNIGGTKLLPNKMHYIS